MNPSRNLTTTPDPKPSPGSPADQSAARDHARVPFFPPVLPLGALAAGIILEWLCPLASRVYFLPPSLRLAAAALLFLPGAVLFFGSGRALRRAGTNVNPNQPTTSVVQRWPFSRTRNPMYLGGNLAYLALGLAVPLYWVLLLFPLPALLCHYLVVRREEAYLVRKFGKEYRTYCRRVPRWL